VQNDACIHTAAAESTAHEVLEAVSRRPLPAVPTAVLEGKLSSTAVIPRGDDVIHQEVRRLIGDVLTLADVGLRVDSGVVGLVGRTRRRCEAEAIQRAVARIPGVVGVRGQIECNELPELA
jgi:hypothetical protein